HAVRELVQIATAEGDHARVVQLLSESAALPFERDVARNMRHEAASVALEKMKDAEGAAALYMTLFEEDPQDERAVSKLVAIYEAQKQPHPLLALRRRQVARAKSVEARVALRRAVAALLLEVDDVERAVTALGENLAEEPRDRATVDDLARIHEAN